MSGGERAAWVSIVLVMPVITDEGDCSVSGS